MTKRPPLSPLLLLLSIAVYATWGQTTDAKKKKTTTSTSPAQQKDTADRRYLGSFDIPQMTRRGPGTGICDNLHANAPLSAQEIIGYFEGVSPFTLKARGNRILIFMDKPQDPQKWNEEEALCKMRTQLRQLAEMGRFSVELALPHARAVGDVVSKVNALNYTDFTIEAVGTDKIRVSSDNAPACSTWTAFLTNVRNLAWGPYPVSPVEKVFYLDGKDVSDALNSSNPSSAVGSQPSQPSPASTPPKKDGGTPANQSNDDANPQADDSATSGSADRAADTGDKSKQKGSNNSNDANTNSGANTSKATGNGKSGDQSNSANGTPANKPASTDTTPKPGAAAQLSSTPDLLVFAEPTPGDDAAVGEKARILAALDLPRPEMVVNVWSSQISSDSLDQVVNQSQLLRQLVVAHNESLQAAVYRAWATIAGHAAKPSDFYDEAFYKYITYKMVYDSPAPPVAPVDTDPSQAAANAFLLRLSNDKTTLTGAEREKWGICEKGKYCLGYTDLFHPLKPRLTDLLLAVIAARDPLREVDRALNAMECRDERTEFVERICEKLRSQDERDPDMIVIPKFYCFRRAAKLLLTRSGAKPDTVGETRSAVADFLFHWKMSKQYPHEFSAYELNQSAQTLNTALAPMVDAFNCDIAAYQTNLRNKFNEYGNKSRDKTFSNGGIVTVRTVSGKETVVDTATQSYLDATEAPTLAQLAKAISDASGSTFPAGVKSNLTTSAILGAMNAMQPSEAKIGRGLKLDIIPRALAGATSSEMDVTLNVDETAEPARFTAGKTSDVNDNTSRVAKHDTNTKIRVDSLKIVEVTSLWAKLQRSRTKIPLILPLVELPYIGSIVGWPRKPAAEYHSSTAVLSAVVIPTAADLAFSTRFEEDRIALARPAKRGWEFRPVVALRDLGQQPIRSYHRAIISCFATGTIMLIPAWNSSPPAGSDCTNLDFDQLPGEAQ
jgi:hypothetical protein